jgi:RNA polymerase sigma factor (sigma-70 family)
VGLTEERALAGDWVGEQLAAYEPALRRYFRKRVPAYAVDDLIQEVFVNLYSRRAPTAVEHIERYLFTVAAHSLQRRMRRDRQWESLEDRDDLEPLEEISPEREVLAREKLANAVAVIENLPPRTREVFLLHRFEEMTYRRIADALGISVSAVEKHMMAALKVLLRDAGSR